MLEKFRSKLNQRAMSQFNRAKIQNRSKAFV